LLEEVSLDQGSTPCTSTIIIYHMGVTGIDR